MAAWSEALGALVAKLDEVEAQWSAQQAAAAMAVGGVTDRLHALGESMTSETIAVHPPNGSAPGEVVGSSQWDEPLKVYSGIPGLLDRTDDKQE